MKFVFLGLRLALAGFQRLCFYLTFGEFPAFASVVVVIRERDKILIIDRRDGKGFGLPGGHIKLNETAEEAARREVKEETGLELEIIEILGTLSGKRRQTWVRTVDVVYSGRVTGGTLRHSREGRIQWMTLEAVWQNLAFDYREIFARLSR